MRLARSLGLGSAIAVLIGSVIGSGIFRSPAGIAARLPDERLFLLAWIIGGLLSLCGALTFAELSAALPRTGGIFVYLREGFGRLPAFLFGWAELTIIRGSALGAISLVFAEYFLRFFSVAETDLAVRIVAVSAVLAVATLNFMGIRLGALVQNTTTVAKFGVILLLAGAAFLIGARVPAPEATQALSLGRTASMSVFGLALISVLWVYDGWADVTFLGGEVKRPERNLPLALILGTLAVIAVYALANLAYLRLLPIQQIATSRLVAADAAYRIVGDFGVKLVSLTVMISAFGALNGSMMTGPRIFFAMAESGLFFRGVAAVHPRFRTPYVAIWLAAALAIGFLMIQTFEQLADAFVLGIWPFYAGGVAAVFVLRRKRPDLERPYRVWGYPFTPMLFIGASVYLLANALVSDFNALIGFAIILAGIPVFYLWEERTRA